MIKKIAFLLCVVVIGLVKTHAQSCTNTFVTSFQPATGPANTVVTLTGSGFQNGSGVSAVFFNGIPATEFTVISDTQITAPVPDGASTGTVWVTGNGGCTATAAGTFTPLTSSCTGGEIYISEIYDAEAGSPGAIELYNPTGSTITFNSQYVLERYGVYTDANPSGGYILTLAGSIPAYSTYLVRTGPAPCGLSITPVMGNGINENDAIKLRKNGSIIDVVHAPNEVGYTIIRKPNAIAPATPYNAADWNTISQESCANLGMHTATPPVVATPTVLNPDPVTICLSDDAVFSTGVSGAGYTYQWKTLNTSGNWVNVTNGGNYSGATSDTFIVSNAPAALTGSQYYCQITSATCTLVSHAALLTVVSVPQAALTPTQPDCSNATGTITVTAPLGSAYSYSIDNGDTWQTAPAFQDVAPGSHTIFVKHTESGCLSAGTTQVINTPVTTAAPLFGTTDPSCTTPTGTITISSPTGTGYTYSIGGAYQSSPLFEGVPPGQHPVTVKDAAGCISESAEASINPAPDSPDPATTTVGHPDCDTATGTITVTAPLGTGYSYSIDGGNTWSTTPQFTVPAGTYVITTQNTAGCTSVTGNIVVNPQPAPPGAAAVQVQHPDCDTATGTINITSPLGAGYEYSINGGTTWTATPQFTVPAGTYAITTQNAAGCTALTPNITVNPQPAPPAVASVQVGHPDCDTATGIITINTPVGTGYQYSIDGGNTWVTTPQFNVPAGTYVITTQNAAGCTSATGNIVVNPQPTAPAAPTVSLTPATCTTTAAITVTSPTGAGFTYSINGVNYVTSPAFSVTEGTYNITVKNAAGCISPATQQAVGPAPAVPAAPLAGVTHPGCNGTTGTITVTSPTGTGYTYSIDNTNYVTTTTFTLAPGSYPLTVKNADGCISSATIKVINAAPATPVAPALTPQHPVCGQTTGSITVTLPTGPGLTYSKDGGTTWQPGTTFSSLASGTYSIIAKNAAGCISASASETINPAPAAVAVPVLNPIQPDCNVASGTITVTSPTGTGYTYSINNGPFQVSPVFTPLQQGMYTITVKNSGGCTATKQQIINAAPAQPPVPTVAIQHPDCDTAVGRLTVTTPTGGGHTYSIDGVTFQPSPVFLNVSPGTYTITVRNNPGCTNTVTVTVNPQPAPAPSPGTITGNSVVCIDDTLQLANTATGGTWASSNPNVATVDATGFVTPVNAGTVTITYTVGTVCTDSAQKTIVITPLPQPHPPTQVYLCEEANGTFSPAIIDSGMPQTGFTYTWEKDGDALPDTTSAITVNQPGLYTVTVTNPASGCSTSASTTVGTSSLAIAYAEAGPDFHINQNITVHVTGGSGVYEYSLDGGPYQDSPYFGGINDGYYTVTVRDKNGCGTIELDVFALNYPHYFTPNGDGIKDIWNIRGLAGQHDALIYIYDRYGKLVSGFRPGAGGWDGTLNGYPLPATDYWFTVSYRTANGQRKEFKAHFSLLR